MGVRPEFDRLSFRRLLHEVESPLRCQGFPEDIVRAVMRYGGAVGSEVRHFTSLARGMDRARSLIDSCEDRGDSFAGGLVIVADELTGGKGRFSRQWHAPPGGLWLTVVLVNTLLAASSSLYSLAAGVAVAETLLTLIPEARLKWVNDLLVDGKKIAGVLVETHRGRSSHEEYILLGVGINVNNRRFPAELADSAVSISQYTGVKVDLDALLRSFLAKLTWNIGLLHAEEAVFLEDGGISAAEDSDGLARGVNGREHLLVARFKELSDTVGRRVIYGHDVRSKPLFEARVLEIDGAGRLGLALDDGSIVFENSGEILYLD